MGRPTLKINRTDPLEIKKLLSQKEDYKVGIRLYMIYMVSLGHSSRKLAELHQVSFKQITNWVHQFEKEGIDGLRDKKGRGRRGNLSDDQLQKIKLTILDDNPAQHGLSSTRWNGPLIAQWIKQEYGVEYKKAQIYNLLKRIGIVFEKRHGLIVENK